MRECLPKLVGVVLLACQFVMAGSNNPFAIPQKVTFIRKDQIWTMVADGSQLRQLTHGGNPKWQPEWSSDGTKIVYVVNGTVSNPIQSHVVLINTKGRELANLGPYSPAGGSALKQIDYGQLIGPGRLGIESGLNPSLAYYQVYDLKTHIPVAGYLGYGFLWSPDATELAHVGWIPHFAPLSAQSEYLQIYDRTIYNPQTGHEYHALQVIRWGPDSEHLALIDNNQTLHTRNLVVLDIKSDTPVETYRLPGDIGPIAEIQWVDRSSLLLCVKKSVWRYRLRSKRLQPAAEQFQAEYTRMLRKRCAVVHKLNFLRGYVPDFWPKEHLSLNFPGC